MTCLRPILLVAAAFGWLVACVPAAAHRGAAELQVTRLAPGVWSFVSRRPGDGYPANGWVVEEGEGAVLVDTGWTPGDAHRVLVWAEHVLGHPVRRAVVTHFHEDRLGGLPALRERGIPVWGLVATARLAAAHGRMPPDQLIDGEATVGPLQLFFPGAGHAPDNLVVWHPASKSLFGGCMVKAGAEKGLGYVGDADLAQWPASLREVRRRYPGALRVTPGHGSTGGPELLEHTLKLLSSP